MDFEDNVLSSIMLGICLNRKASYFGKPSQYFEKFLGGIWYSEFLST